MIGFVNSVMTKVEYLDMSTVDKIVFTVCHEYSDCSYKEMENKWKEIKTYSEWIRF